MCGLLSYTLHSFGLYVVLLLLCTLFTNLGMPRSTFYLTKLNPGGGSKSKGRVNKTNIKKTFICHLAIMQLSSHLYNIVLLLTLFDVL